MKQQASLRTLDEQETGMFWRRVHSGGNVLFVLAALVLVGRSFGLHGTLTLLVFATLVAAGCGVCILAAWAVGLLVEHVPGQQQDYDG